MRWILTPILVASLLFAFPAFAELSAYKLIKEKSSLKFYALQNGAPVEGEFKDFTADIHFDPDKLDASKIVVEVDTSSVEVANSDVLQNIKLPEWLSVKAFPKAIFKSKKISRMPNSDNYYSEGVLSLRGKTLPVMLNFQVQFSDKKNAISKGYITLRRTDFGVGQGNWAKDDVIKNEVRIEFRVVAEKQ